MQKINIMKEKYEIEIHDLTAKAIQRVFKSNWGKKTELTTIKKKQ